MTSLPNSDCQPLLSVKVEYWGGQKKCQFKIKDILNPAYWIVSWGNIGRVVLSLVLAIELTNTELKNIVLFQNFQGNLSKL